MVVSENPLNIGHRGSSGILPENTAEAHSRAYQDGADIVECDVVLTKDLRVLCSHESWLSATTNIADIFTEDRMTTHFVDDQNIEVTDYFSVDFTFDELQLVRVNQRRDYRDKSYNGLYKLPSLEEVFQVMNNAGSGKGLYVEIKDPLWVNSLSIVQDMNTTFEDIIINIMNGHGCEDASDPCVVQSFSDTSLNFLKDITSLRLAILLSLPADVSESELIRYAEYCYAVNPSKNMIVRQNLQGHITERTDLVERAHAHGLKVNTWTLRNEDRYLAWDYLQDPYLEYQDLLDMNIDGFITDFPATLTRFFAAIGESDDTSGRTTDQSASSAGAVASHVFVFISALSILFL